MIAHVGGLPVEEVLPALVSGVSVWSVLWLTWRADRLPRLRSALNHFRH